MKFLVLSCLVVAAAAWHSGFDEHGNPMSRIVGGVEVSPPGKYPFMVRARGCGGALISPEWVLTAGHCVNVNNAGANGPLYLGRHQSGSGGVQVQVTQVIRHPQYGSANESDSALLRISPAINAYAPIALDSGSGPWSTPGVDNTVIGWGALSEGGPQSSTLQEVTLPVITNQQCGQVMNINAMEICMGRPAGGQDACQGDSGGPMFYQDGSTFAITGVVSWGIGCARPNRYGVYARVSAALPWILQYVPDAIVV